MVCLPTKVGLGRKIPNGAQSGPGKTQRDKID